METSPNLPPPLMEMKEADHQPDPASNENNEEQEL
jgi:hypothetical protein